MKCRISSCIGRNRLIQRRLIFSEGTNTIGFDGVRKFEPHRVNGNQAHKRNTLGIRGLGYSNWIRNALVLGIAKQSDRYIKRELFSLGYFHVAVRVRWLVLRCTWQRFPRGGNRQIYQTYAAKNIYKVTGRGLCIHRRRWICCGILLLWTTELRSITSHAIH